MPTKFKGSIVLDSVVLSINIVAMSTPFPMLKYTVILSMISECEVIASLSLNLYKSSKKQSCTGNA